MPDIQPQRTVWEPWSSEHFAMLPTLSVPKGEKLVGHLSSSQVWLVMSVIHLHHWHPKQLVPSFLLTGKEEIPPAGPFHSSVCWYYLWSCLSGRL